MNKKENYSADSIFELKFPDAARQKVGMYLGDSSQNGFFHTLTEIVDNSLDEFVVGYGEKLIIKINSKTKTLSVRDFGRGIPFTKNKNGVSALYLAMTTLHAGGKHKRNDEKSIYKYSSGINGVGASVVNAVSNFFIVESYRDGKKATIKWENGLLKEKLLIVDNIENEPNGTYVKWQPSIRNDEFDHFNVFESDVELLEEDIIEKFQYMPYLNIGLSIDLYFDDKKIIFKKVEKVSEILKFGHQKLIMKQSPYFKEELCLLLNKKTGNKKTISMKEFIDLPDKEKNEFEIKTSLIELTFNFTNNPNPLILNFANGIKLQGGKPEQAFKYQFKQILNNYLQEQGKKINFEVEDIFASLTFMLAVKIDQPQLSGQTKDKLNNPESSTLTTFFVKKYLTYWINRLDKNDLMKIIKVIEVAKKIRETSKRIKDTEYKSISKMKDDELALEKGKLEDCTSNDPTKNELYIVEGDSASGGIRISRNNKYQAFIPLKGKPLNVMKKINRSKILKNEEIKSLAYSLGGINDDFNIDKIKYHKIVILADADLDGYHISALMMTFFYKFYPEIIKKGYLYVALSPLYKIIKNKKIYWAWNIKEMEKITSRLKSGYIMTRNKGLGEMNPDDLFETTLNPKNRKFIRITLEDVETLEKNINIFMGDTREGKLTLKKIFKQYYIEHIDQKNVITFTAPEK